MKIGIMGGTFNPIHNAHLMIAEFAREQFGLDCVWFMTSGNPPHKRNLTIVDAHIRQEMVSLAIDKNPYFKVCDYEVERREYSYTANTLSEFSQRYPDDEFFFIIGSDSLCQLNTWYKPEIIARLCTILVFSREGNHGLEQIAEKYRHSIGADIRIIGAPIFDISSSLIRARVKEGRSIRYMVCDEVNEYIRRHGLYKQEISE